MMEQSKAPIFEKLKDFATQNKYSFHVPGHKFGAQLDEGTAAYFRNVMQLDTTEITGMDDLHHPREMIQEAQQLAAQCFGAEHTFFLVNGSTVGNLAMILATCNRGDIIIVQRNAHKSILHGIILAGAQPVFLSPQIDRDSQLATGVRVEHIQAALDQYPEAKAVLLTNPNYYGMSVDMKSICELVHRYNKPVLVDEAHGAHFGFHTELPPSALSCGADAVVQSTHKMLTALTMGSMLHIQGNRLNRDLLQQRLSMLQSSSPSYPIMASLDVSRRNLAIHGQAQLDKTIEMINQFKKELNHIPGFSYIDMSPTSAYERLDPFKVSVWDQTGTCSGYELQQELERNDCMIEMADSAHVVLFFSLFTSPKDCQKLLDTFSYISKKFSLEKKELNRIVTNINMVPPFTQVPSPLCMELEHLFPSTTSQKEVQKVELMESVNARSAEMIIPYPPGIPVVFPGERITLQMASYLQRLSMAGVAFQGAKDIHLSTIEVYK